MNDHNEPRQPALDRLDVVAAAGLGLVALYCYMRTLLPGLVPNDSAEFQTLAYTLDHAHTTGYEVYVVMAKLFTLLPWNSVAYRVNLFSAVMGALTVTLVYLAGRLLSGSRWGGVVGAAALMFSATFWSQAIIAEVYTAGSAFTAAILLLALLWNTTRRARYLFAAGLLGGVGLGVHGTVALLAPAVLVLLLLNWQGWRRFWIPALAGTLLGVALMVAAFALVDAHETQASILHTAYIPSISRWGMQPDELDSFGERFRFLFFARQWRTAMFQDPLGVMPGNLWDFLRTLGRDFSVIVVALYLAGLIALFAGHPRRWKLGVFFLTAILAHNLYTFNYQIGDLYVFFISFYVYLCVLAAEGAAALLRLLEISAGRVRGGLQLAALRTALALLVLAVTVLPFAGERAGFLRQGQARWEFMGLPSNGELQGWHDYIRFTVQELPPNAIVLTDWYNLYGFVYEAHVEQGRTDLLFMEAYPYSTQQGMADTLLVFLAESIEQGRPVYTMQRLDELRRGGFDFYARTVGVTSMYVVEKD